MGLVVGTNCGFVPEAPSADPEDNSGIWTLDNYALALKVTAPDGATAITEIGWWCDNATQAANFDVGIYSHNSGTDLPSSLLASSGDVAKGTDAGWKSAAVSCEITAGTTYWLAVALDNTATATKAELGNYSSNRVSYKAQDTPLAASWSSDGTGTYRHAIYAVYTTAAGSTYAVACSDGITFAIVGDEGAVIQGAIADGVSLSDVSGNIAEMFAAVAEGITGADSPTRILGIPASVADGFTGADAGGNLKAMPVILIDGIALSDSVLTVMQLLAAVADGARFSDTAAGLSSAVQEIAAAVADGVTLSDSTLSMLSAFATASDGARFSDYNSLAGLVAALAADGIALSDTAAGNLALLVSMSDGITVSDTGEVTLNLLATAGDGIRLADTIATIMQLFGSLSDGVEFSDSPSGTNASTPLPSGRMKIYFAGRSATIAFSGKRGTPRGY